MTKDLIEILSWCRGSDTKSELTFVNLHIATIPGISQDDYGNFHLLVGDENPEILWSCHTDTVTRKEGRQNVQWVSKGVLGLHNGKPGQCLGADDGGGLYIMLELIKAGKPGYYVFHRDEEVGGKGSSWLRDNPFHFPPSIKYAIAMDRCGTKDIITHQGWSRCCSDEFALSLGEQLGMGYIPDDTGIFTDTANYTGLFAECTNLSIGYERNHGHMETLDVTHLLKLKQALLKLDPSKLVCKREPGEDDYTMGGYMSNYGYGASNMSGRPDLIDPWEDSYPPFEIKRAEPDFADMVRNHPGIAARLMEDLGVSAGEFRAHVFAFTGHVYEG